MKNYITKISLHKKLQKRDTVITIKKQNKNNKQEIKIEIKKKTLCLRPLVDLQMDLCNSLSVMPSVTSVRLFREAVVEGSTSVKRLLLKMVVCYTHKFMSVFCFVGVLNPTQYGLARFQ